MQEDNLSDITLTPRIPTVEENPFIATAQKMAQPDQLGLNAPEDNPFLAIAKGMGGMSQPPAIGSIASTLSINPDQAAQASKLGGQFGLGQDIALRNMDELRRRSLITRLQQTGMLDKNPALAESLANPAFSAQAHDDIDNLAETGSWIDSIYKGFEGGFLMQEMGELRFSPLSGERFYGATAAQQERIEQVRKRMQETQGSGVLYMTAQVIAQQLAQAKGIGTAALTGFGIGGATGGAPGAIAGGGVGAATGVVLTTAQMEAGLLYDELEQAGVDPEIATTAAVIGGVINGAIELAGAKIAARPFKPLIRKLIADRVEALAMPTMRSAIRQGVKGYGIQVGTETIEETVQEITAMATSEIAKAADGIDSELTWTDALTRITDAAIGGFQGSLLLGGIGPGANAIVDVRRAKQTESQQKWLDGLQERVAESKVRERNPNAFQEFVEKQVEGKPVATIYVDAEEAKGVLAQLNLTVSQVDAIVPGFAEQVRTEAERGGDVTIPTAVFSAKLANTDLGNALRPHMRLSPEALSVTQLEAVRAERERMSAAGQDVIDERLAAEDTAFVESATRVEQTMYEELTAAGQPATEAKINAEFVRNMMASLADRVGVTPEQMFERYPYRVRGEGQAEQAQALEQPTQFDQAGERRTDTPEFKAWNERLQDEGGTNKLTTESGQPMRFYHGTTRGGFSAFDPSFLNTGAGYSRGGFSFVNVRERAEAYAQRGNVDRRILDEKIAMLNKLIADPSVNQQLFRAGIVENEFFEFEDEPPVVDQFLSNEELEDVIRSYVYDLRRAGNEALASQFDSILDVSDPTSDPEVYEVYLYAGQNVREVDATPETIGQVLAGIDVRNQPGGAIIVNLPDGEKVVYVSDPTNIKSVDNRGTWSRETTDIYKQASRMDADYMAAVERDDMDAARRMVDEAARSVGLTELVWRGDRAGAAITQYRRGARREPGIFTTTTQEIADKYAGGSGLARQFYVGGRTLDLTTPTAETLQWIRQWAADAEWDFVDRTTGEQIAPEDAVMSGLLFDWEGTMSSARWKDIQATAAEQGYDIVKLIDMDEQTFVSTVVLNENRIKLADPVTYDESGNVVPLSRRFNLASPMVFEQAARGQARGGFDPQKLLTTLNKDADFSTFAHETAHYFLTILGDVASRPDAPASVLDDMNTLLRWFGVKDLATWNAMSLDQQRQYHEQFAYSFETYLFEGKAPSVEMQGLFDQFARWLKQVYQGLITKINDVYKAEFGKDLPILTGEVRQVMDRMLATEDQIARAQAIREMKPQFQTQEQSGMDDAAWAAYQELQEQATERAVAELTTATLKEMAWMSRARGRKLRELQRQHDDKRKEIRDEVAEDLRILPVYRAMEFLKRGKVVDVDGTTKPATGQFKLSAAGVQAVMPPGFDVATLGRGRYGMVNEDGLHPDLIAPLYGYASGAELVTALSTAKPFADAVAERTDQRMLSEFSELADPAARSLAVDRAIHNEARARLIAVEQRWAAKLQQPVSVIMEAASQVAGEIIGRQAIRTLSPRAYAAAEARAARLATSAYSEPQSPEQAGQTAATRAYNAAIAAGRTVDEATVESLSAGVAAVETARQRRAEFDAKYGGKTPAEVVMRAKRQQLLQNMLARQALEARAEIDRARSAFKRFFGSDEKIAKTRNMEMVSAARAILGWYGFGKRDESPAEYVDQLRAYNPAAYAQLEPLILRATKGPQDYRDLTVDEFRVLRDTVDGLWIQARKDKQVKLGDRTMALDEVVGELDQRLEEIGVPKVVAGEKRAPTFRDRAARHLMTLRSTMRRVESWADAMDGVSTVRPFTNYLVRPVLDAVDKFTASRNKYMKRFRDLVVNLQMPEGTISAPELDYTFGAGNAGIGKAELLGALLHTGNASNYRKLLLGRGWGQEDEFGNLDDTQFKAFVKRMQDEGVLTKADYEFLQSVWDLNEDIKPIAQKAHYELYGFYFTEIPATEVVTPFGTYRGGYVPAATDKFMVTDAAQRAGEEELESDWRNSLPSTGRGFTQTRMAGYNKALSLDVRVIGAHIDSALRFSMIQPAITQALRILRSREFAARLDRVDPTVKQELLIPWLNRTARQLVSQPGKYKAVDAFWRGVRTRTGMSIMVANLRVAMQQFTGLFPAGVKVQPRYLTAALTEYVGSPQRTANSVAVLSPFMEDRLKGQSFEVQEQINDVLLNPSRFDRAQAWTDRHGYFLQQAFQNMVDVVTWVGAYNQSLSTTDTTVTAEEAQREAIAAGDAAVRLTQGSVRPSDVSAFESGTPFFRTLTQFAGYFNMLANLNATEYVKVIRDMGFRGNKGKLVYIYMMGFMLPAVVADAIVRTLGGGWEDEDEDGYLDTFMDWFFGSQIRQGVAFVPFGTTAYTLATTAFDDKPYNDRMTTSPSVASLEAATVGVGKAAIAVVDEEKDVTGKNVRDVLTLLSLATGIPFSVLGRPAGYLVDVQRGEVEPTSTYDMIRGTITGTATPESKR